MKHGMSNNQWKKLQAKRFNEAREKANEPKSLQTLTKAERARVARALLVMGVIK